MADMTERLLRRAAEGDDAWEELIDARSDQLRHFLEWAAACGADAPDASLRLRWRGDVGRCRSTLDLFDEP
jgi:hypothetical protein